MKSNKYQAFHTTLLSKIDGFFKMEALSLEAIIQN